MRLTHICREEPAHDVVIPPARSGTRWRNLASPRSPLTSSGLSPPWESVESFHVETPRGPGRARSFFSLLRLSSRDRARPRVAASEQLSAPRALCWATTSSSSRPNSSSFGQAAVVAGDDRPRIFNPRISRRRIGHAARSAAPPWRPSSRGARSRSLGASSCWPSLPPRLTSGCPRLRLNQASSCASFAFLGPASIRDISGWRHSHAHVANPERARPTSI